MGAPRVAVVGGGPAGFFSIDALLKGHRDVRVDLFEKLLVPYGLVRYGVAPDHWTVKSKAEAFSRMLDQPRVRFWGNVRVGDDVTVDELRERYQAVVFACGASHGRQLGIEGESLPGVLSAPELVAWYNGHPERPRLEPMLDARSVAIVGMGNVALDVARILLLDPSSLDRTDAPTSVVERLAKADVRQVHVLGRRGPSQTSFTPKELVEVSELPDVGMVVDEDDIARDVREATGPSLAERRRERSRELFAEWAANPSSLGRRQVRFHFGVSPSSFVGAERVTAVRLMRNRLERSQDGVRPVPIDASFELPVDLVVTAIGYRSRPIVGLPHDPTRGLVPSEGGRVVAADGTPMAGVYVTGWLRRGATGVIGTNKTDACEVVAALLEDLPRLPPPKHLQGDAQWLREAGVELVDTAALRRLERAERLLGSLRGKRAEKYLDADRALRFLRAVSCASVEDSMLEPILEHLA